MAGETTFEAVAASPEFPKLEEKTMKWWDEIKAFESCLEQSKGKKPYVFYDGPPFATGLPHYGHILAGTIKDVLCRYAHQRGHHVERRFGWDCHGLPIEYEIDKVFHLKGKPDVLKMGIDKYNEECRKIVQRFTGEWRHIVTRFGRWIDFDNDYKTMDITFMESCWWVFKQLYDKDAVYRAFRVMPFSTACGTPLSNFEVSQNYKEVSDPSVIVQIKVANKENTWLLAWTTTPWTLPSNAALCVNPDLTYLRVKKKEDGAEWILGKDRFAWVCQSIKKDQKGDFELLEEVKGKDLVGIQYIPLFDYFKDQVINDKVWHVVSDGYVSTEAGTCIVHQAPAFGEDDMRVCQKHGIIQKDGKGLFCPVDDAGCFTSEVTDFQGMHVKVADKDIKDMLKKKGNLVFSGNEVHQYPHCWRSDTPLIYKAMPSWFIKVEEIREKLIANNNKTYWVPKFVKEKRFHNWLSEARDWCVSRTRYWGTPIPLWVSDDLKEVVCVGSVEELEKHAGRKLTDIHRHFIDDIQIPSKQGKGMLKRVEEVFDCWFESGSMPYASKHYPFEKKDVFEKSFPAQFVAEGLDQTRGWFYTLMVLSTHLFNEPPFQNLIVNGLVLAADGKKMSKRLKNYPDPQDIVKSYGADAVRMYMCNSPGVRAEPLKFKEEGVRDVVKDVLLPWYNAYRFFIQESFRYESTGKKFKPDPDMVKASENFMDKWIIASCHSIIQFTREEMEAYRLYTVVPRLVTMLEDLTNWYIRLNRERMRGNNGPENALLSLGALYEVLLNVSVLLAPVTPFLTELIYGNLSRALPDGHPMKAKSVHFVMTPEPDAKALDPEITQAVARMQSIVELGRTCREWKKVGLKVPLRSMTIMNSDESFINDIKKLQKYLQEELNVMEVVYRSDSTNMTLVPTLNFKVLGKKLGKDMKAVQKALETVSQEELRQYEATGKMTICGHTIEAANEEMSLAKKVEGNDDPNLQATANAESTVIMDFTEEEGLKYLGIARVVANLVQKLRKDAKLNQDDPVDMWAGVIPSPTGSGILQKVLDSTGDDIAKFLRRPLWNVNLMQGHEICVKKEELELENVGGDKLAVSITVRGAYFLPALKKLAGGDASVEEALKQYVRTYDLEALTNICSQGGLKACIGDKSYELKYRQHFTLGVAEANESSANGETSKATPKETAPKKEAAPKKKGKEPTKEKEGNKSGGSKDAKEPTKEGAVDRKAMLKKVIKEGGKRGVEIEGAADMGGLQFFCTSVDEPQGDVEFLMESMKAMNAQSDPTEEERKGGSGNIGKMIFSAGGEQLAVLAYTPEAKLDQISCEDWLKAVLATQGGEVLSTSTTLCMGRVKTDTDKNVFPLKIREPMILEANNFLRKKGLFPEDNDDSDEMVFGDDDFPS